MSNMMKVRTLYIPEILDLVEAAKTKEAKIKILHDNRSTALGVMLAYTYDDRYKFILSTKEVDLVLGQKTKKTFDIMGTSPTHLYREYSRFGLFVVGQGTVVPKEKLMEMLAQLREAINPLEFEVVIKMMKKQPLTPSLTVDLLKEAFPSLLPKD